MWRSQAAAAEARELQEKQRTVRAEVRVAELDAQLRVLLGHGPS